MTTRPDEGKSERLAIRASRRERRLLDEASRAEGSTLSDFVLRHATRAAEDVLADRRLFTLSRERWMEFSAALDRPAREIPELRKLFESLSVLEQG